MVVNDSASRALAPVLKIGVTPSVYLAPVTVNVFVPPPLFLIKNTAVLALLFAGGFVKYMVELAVSVIFHTAPRFQSIAVLPPLNVNAVTVSSKNPIPIPPAADLATMVDAPLDADAVVAELGIDVNAAPEPEKAPENVVVVSVFVLGLKLSPVSVLSA